MENNLVATPDSTGKTTGKDSKISELDALITHIRTLTTKEELEAWYATCSHPSAKDFLRMRLDELKAVAKAVAKNTADFKPMRCEKHGEELPWIIAPFSGSVIRKSCSSCVAEDNVRVARQASDIAARERQVRVNRRLDNSMIAPRFREKTLESFKVECEGQKKAVEDCKWFIENYAKSMGLIFIGGPGTGKNHLASALVKFFIEHHDKTALMTEAIKVIRAIKESWRGGEKSETQAIRAYIEPDLLVIDEVGIQFGSETEKLYLTEIINDRYNWMRPTVLIGNVTLDEMKKAIGERAVERFREGGKVVVFDWGSYRGRKE